MTQDLAIALAILRGPAEAVVASDRDGRIVLWNPGAERIFGFTAAEAVGNSLDLIIPEPLRARHWQGYRHVMETGQSRYGSGELLSVPALHRNGGRISVQFTIVPVPGADGRIEILVAVLRDQTAQFEELKALRRAAAAKAV